MILSVLFMSHVHVLEQYFEFCQRWGVILLSEGALSDWDWRIFGFGKSQISASCIPRVRSPTKSPGCSLKWTSEEKELFEQGLVSLFIYIKYFKLN